MQGEGGASMAQRMLHTKANAGEGDQGNREGEKVRKTRLTSAGEGGSTFAIRRPRSHPKRGGAQSLMQRKGGRYPIPAARRRALAAKTGDDDEKAD